MLLYAMGSNKAFSPHPCHWTRMLELYGPRLGDCPPGFYCDKQVIYNTCLLVEICHESYICINLIAGLGELVDSIPQVWENQGSISIISPFKGCLNTEYCFCFRDNQLYTLYNADQASFAVDHRAAGYHLSDNAGK